MHAVDCERGKTRKSESVLCGCKVTVGELLELMNNNSDFREGLNRCDSSSDNCQGC